MNRRLRELVEQTGFRYDNGEWQFGDDSDVQKFAELIVRECAQVCLAQRDPANLNYKPSKRCAEAVKQHFGVQ